MTEIVRIIRWCATAKAAVGLLCVVAMCFSGRIADLNTAGVPLVLPCSMAALWGLRGAWLARGTLRGLTWAWSLVLVLGACHWARAPILRVAYDLEGTTTPATFLYGALVATEAFHVERFLPLALWLVAGWSIGPAWLLPAICLSVPLAVELGAAPLWAYWLACLAPIPALLSAARRKIELVRACALWVAGSYVFFIVAFRVLHHDGPSMAAAVFAAAALIPLTSFPRKTNSCSI